MILLKSNKFNFFLPFVTWLLVSITFAYSQETYNDNFNNVSYSNNNGSSNFSSGWDEDNDGDSPSGGNIRIRNHESSNQLRFDELDSNDRIGRTLNLNGANSVILTFDYDADDRGNEGLNVELWNDTSSSWETIASINITNSSTITHTLTTNQISTNSEIRFVSNSGGWGNNERIYIDNVLFTATYGPSISIGDEVVDEGSGSAVFTVTHSGPNTLGPYVVNYSIIAGTATQGLDYSTASGFYTGTITFNGTSGDTEQITVLITDDSDTESSETFFIEFVSATNNAVDISDTAIGSINDNDSFIITNGITDNTCSGTFFDNGGFGNYSNNQDRTYTLCPDSVNSDLSISFSTFDVESGYDYLYIYDGSNTGGALIGQFDSANPPPTTITSTNAAGCLTFRFTSDGSVTRAGWEAAITCIDRVPQLTISDIVVNEDDGNAVFTVTHIGTNTTGPFSASYQTVDGTAIAGSDYTSISGGTLTFSGIAGDTETITVSILDDGSFENPETYSIEFTSVSDASVIISDTALGTINDDDVLIMTNGVTVNTCSDAFLDPGGTSNYANNLDVVYTICPDTANHYLSTDFSNFDVISGDMLYVYDGNSTSATLIGQYDNNNIPTNISSSGGSGCLTFRFTSNNNNTGTGFQAVVKCYQEGPRLVIDDVTVDEDAGTAVFTVTSTRAAHGRNVFLLGFVNTQFTVDYTTTNGSALAGSDYTTTTGTLTFSGEIGNQRTISVPIINDGVPEFDENFTIEFTGANAPDVPVNFDDTGVGTINSQILANVPLTLFKQFDGDFDYTTTGGSLRTQSNGANACAIQTTSTNRLVAPITNTGNIAAAYLYWAHSSYIRDEQITFEGQTVDAGFVYQTTFNASGTNLSFFGYVSDVTSLVSGITNINTNDFDFSGLTVDTSNNFCSTATVLGGWSLIVFYEDSNLPAVNINLYQGFDGLQNAGTSFTLDSFFAIAGAGAKATFLSWEGDETLDGNTGTNPEALSITNQANTNFNLTGDGGNPGNNAYNSSIFDNSVPPVYNTPNIYGLDLDTYDISTFITPGDSQVTANVDVGQDYVINNAVVIKVPSNLITGTVFEDVNYPGGNGRDQLTSGGVPVTAAIVELYESDGTFIERKNTNVNGDYTFAGMQDGDYLVKVVNSSVRSSRGNGLNCTACFAVQTYRNYGDATLLNDVTTEIGGANPAATQDAALGILTDAQSVSLISVASNGVVGVDFGFNFNTIVNTNENGQGSLEQFIINSNNLDETGLDIEANGIFDPAPGDDTSVFMIPPTSDALGRTADVNFINGYFDIVISNGNPLSIIAGTNTNIDGRTQTAYSGNSNTGTVGSGGTSVGTSSNILPDFNRPEIQVYRAGGDVLKLTGTNTTIRSIAVNANNNAGVRIQNGSAIISNNLLGVNALGSAIGNIDSGVEITGGTAIIEANYISDNTDQGVWINGGTSTLVRNNEITINGNGACNDNILIESGTGISITQNLISSAASFGIEIETGSGGITISENTIINSGQNGGNCGGSINNAGVSLFGDDSAITNNIVASNGGAGIVLMGGNSTGNLISQNSIYANGTVSPALGIDILNDGVTLNDSGDSDNGPNGVLNFPLISGAYLSGGNIVIEGWSRPGSTIELFLTDINEGSAISGDNAMGLSKDYGEGQLYIGTVIEGGVNDADSRIDTYTDIDGNTDNTNRYKVVFPAPLGAVVGSLLTSTATIANSTSEFSPESILKTYTIITNRRITYRVKKN
ncbi:right-handed parallel beta-helix repeat-containing protein [Aurantibacter crassamenti]|uniref:beta strand repeat-containing protein n=1 Tax=Aurantibacter crassamenti TaxID=1837375 RepID=UPI0019393636|nr:Calx-beta domain-containing protein [Aurantibacter crassamenti]MBM1107964.1 right-handed parallel beta-helix repeat-containing protein [Aurantibacter crassamenti]